MSACWRAPVRSAPIPAATTNPMPMTASGPGHLAEDDQADQQGDGRLQAHQRAECRGVEATQGEHLQGERHDRAGARPGRSRSASSSGVILPMTAGPTASVATEPGDRHRDRQSAEPARPRRRRAASAGCTPPSSTPLPARRPRRPGPPYPPRARSAAARRPRRTAARRSGRSPRPRATATPSGPRNSSALAIPSGSRATALHEQQRDRGRGDPEQDAGDERRTGVTAPATACRSPGTAAPAQTSRSHAVPSAPMRSIRRHRDRQPDLDAHASSPSPSATPVRTRLALVAGESAGRGHASSQGHANRSCPRENRCTYRS